MRSDLVAFEVSARLERIERLLEQLVAAQRPPEGDAATEAPRLRARDRRTWERLRPVLVAAFGADAEFTVAEVREVAETDSAQGADLRLALGGISAIALGRLFERATNAGLMRKVGSGREGSRWSTLADLRFQTGKDDAK